MLIQKAHFKSPNLARLEAAVRVYAPLSRVAGDVSGVVPAAAGAVLQKDVRKKMTGLLLHPFPRVCFSFLLGGVLLGGYVVDGFWSLEGL